MLADVDFFIEFPDGHYGILECKTTNYNCQDKWKNDTTPVNYEYQGRHYMAVMNLNEVYFACMGTTRMSFSYATWKGTWILRKI